MSVPAPSAFASLPRPATEARAEAESHRFGEPIGMRRPLQPTSREQSRASRWIARPAEMPSPKAVPYLHQYPEGIEFSVCGREYIPLDMQQESPDPYAPDAQTIRPCRFCGMVTRPKLPSPGRPLPRTAWTGTREEIPADWRDRPELELAEHLLDLEQARAFLAQEGNVPVEVTRMMLRRGTFHLFVDRGCTPVEHLRWLIQEPLEREGTHWIEFVHANSETI